MADGRLQCCFDRTLDEHIEFMSPPNGISVATASVLVHVRTWQAVCADMYTHMFAGMCADVCADMCIEMRAGMCTDMCAGMYTDMCVLVYMLA